jgi:hypothetical protein
VYVVKTRKVRRDSHKRVKYWARLAQRVPKKPHKRKFNIRKPLRGGFDPTGILKELADFDSRRMKTYCDMAYDITVCALVCTTAREKLKLLEEDPEQYHKLRKQYYETANKYVPENIGLAEWQGIQATAIVAAHETFHGTPCERDFECVYTANKQTRRKVKVLVAESDSVFDAVQANTPWTVYQVTYGKNIWASRAVTFADKTSLLARNTLHVVLDPPRVGI